MLRLDRETSVLLSRVAQFRQKRKHDRGFMVSQVYATTYRETGGLRKSVGTMTG